MAGLIALLFLDLIGYGQKQVLDASMHHLKNGKQIEWDNFSKLPVQEKLVIHFNEKKNETDYTISLRQYDVKQYWRLVLNNQPIDSLVVDGNDMRTYYGIPQGSLRDGDNELIIEPASTIIDEIEIGEVWLHQLRPRIVLYEAELNVEVIDANSNQLTPARITIVDSKGILQTIGTITGEQLAVRPGMVYTGNGKARLQLAAGKYKLYAGRGFEYGLDSIEIDLKKGESISTKLAIKREVQTEGWVSSDTHIHSLTYSGHGDATIRERAITIAGEGVEVPVITEHNLIIDLAPVAKELNLERFFSVIPGDEVTTSVGHFNYFPLSPANVVPNSKVTDWSMLEKNLRSDGNKVIVLNHARDIHNGFRPFDPTRHMAAAGWAPDHWKLPANAMEVVNSGALLSDRMQLFLDWFGMLNRGYHLTPVGGSDSHDVGRYIVGQARTYIKAEDKNAGEINTREVVDNFINGKVMVSFGLLPEIAVNKKFGPGDLATPASENIVVVKVLGPSWINADKVTLFANGNKISERPITHKHAGGVKWSGEWKLSKTKQDLFVVVIAEGQQKSLPYWPIVKPFQPTTTSWSPYVIGCSGAVWIDSDGDGKRTTAFDYANRLVDKYRNDLNTLVTQLNAYDESVAIQATAILYESGFDFRAPRFGSAKNLASASTLRGINKFIEELKLSGRFQD